VDFISFNCSYGLFGIFHDQTNLGKIIRLKTGFQAAEARAMPSARKALSGGLQAIPKRLEAEGKQKSFSTMIEAARREVAANQRRFDLNNELAGRALGLLTVQAESIAYPSFKVHRLADLGRASGRAAGAAFAPSKASIPKSGQARSSNSELLDNSKLFRRFKDAGAMPGIFKLFSKLSADAR
jgi:hypothetical protein